MPLLSLDHVNIRTSRLDELARWYVEVLGFEVGPRPPFSFPGAWLYCEGKPLIHLVGVAAQPRALEPAIEHAAFAAQDLGSFLDRLARHGVEPRIAIVPGFEIIQVNIHDPDGNHLHIDFEPAERSVLAQRAGS